MTTVTRAPASTGSVVPAAGRSIFSCSHVKRGGFCPSCHAKRLEEWGKWMRKDLLLDVPHGQVVFTIPKMLRIFF